MSIDNLRDKLFVEKEEHLLFESCTIIVTPGYILWYVNSEENGKWKDGKATK